MNLYELFIGIRYLKAKKSKGVISFNTVLSISIVVIGVFFLIIVISIFNGFQKTIKDKIFDMNFHISVTNYFFDNDKGIKDYKRLKKRIESVKGIISAEPYIEGPAVFRFRRDNSFVAVRGMGFERSLPDVFLKFIVKGEKKFTNADEVYIGYEMASNRNINIGDKIDLIVPKGKLSVTSNFQGGQGTFKVIGFFKTGYYEFDKGLVLMSVVAAQELYDIGDTVSGIGVKVSNIYNMDYTARLIQMTVGDFQTRTIEEENQNRFNALKLQKLGQIIILFLVIVSALVTILGTVIIVVSEKRQAIGILKSMGAKARSIMTVFILEGFLIGLAGSVIGVILGLITSLNLETIIGWIQRIINGFMQFVYTIAGLGPFEPVSILPKDIYYMDSIPTEISPEFVVTITILTIFLSTIAAVFPAWHASRLQPVETIRYE